ncbi:unnamed protein product [Paramecium pentaurelia]|uniref:Anoctamin transmembrane domain-containing protein n=1 Tax=Paramecium pentaurelia TaxID=43138 RepID=A0A8S1SD88_9CILI|nr:unnamed protein product [Paramecium pentaurelia]
MHFFVHEEINLLEAAQDGKLDFIKKQLLSLTSKQLDPLTSKHLQDACQKSDYYGRNALHYAAYRGHYDVVEYFLDLHCLDLNSKDNQGNSALMLVCVRGYNQDIDESIIKSRDKQLIAETKYKIAKLLLQRGATLGEYLKDYINNPLHWACFYGDFKLTQLLLLKNPNLMLKKNDRKQFPIDIALMKGKDQETQKKVVKYLIVKFLAHFLKSEQHIQQLKSLDENMEESEFDLNQEEIHQNAVDRRKYETVGLNYLFWASVLGDLELVKPLLKQQFSPFAPSYKGRNAVHAAAYHGHDKLIELFFESENQNKKFNVKKFVNIMTIEKPQSALHIAVEQGHEKVVRYLIKIGADHHLYNFRNQTAFASSRSKAIKELRQNLLKTEKNLIKSGYKYVLVGTNASENLVKQQLDNIKAKVKVGKFKAVPIRSYDESCFYYIVKVSSELKNLVADYEKMMIYNFKEGIICQFDRNKAETYENFHHYHDQQIILSLLYDEFDLDQFLHDKLLLDHFPLHDDEEKVLIYNQWKREKWELLKEPLSLKQNKCRTPSAIKAYFGAEVGFFFVFLSFFTTWLFIPAVPGIMLGVYVYATNEINSLFVPIYTIALAVWATIFFEFWKRKQSEMMFQFDMHVETEEKQTIPSFKGQFWIEDVTHKIEIKYSTRDRWKYYKSVTPLVLLAIILIAGEQIGYYYIIQLRERTTEFTILCSIGLGISIKITNEIFNYFARLSLEYENHQYQNELEDVYIIKVFSFAFLNSFGRLFYKSVIDPDADELNIMSITFTIVWAIMHYLRFTIIPLIQYSIKKYFLNKEFELFLEGKWRKMYTSQMASILDNETQNQTNKSFDRKSMGYKKFLRSVEQNKIMIPTPNHVDQFTYFILQFCMVTMFSASSQLIPIAILLFNNINLDGLIYGFITFVKRPRAEAKKSIGLWNSVLLIVGYIGTIINCLTIYYANQDQLNNLIGKVNETDESSQALRNFLLLIAAEHIVIGIKFIIETVIPDEPGWVTKVLKRQEYLLEQMMKNIEIEGSQSDKLKDD